MRRHIATVGLLLAFGAVGCSSGPEGGAIFDNEGGAEVSCMAHQTEEPDSRYRDRATRSTAEVLAMFKYYKNNGAKPYCDNEAAGDEDKAWGDVYLFLGGGRDVIPTVLG